MSALPRILRDASLALRAVNNASILTRAVSPNASGAQSKNDSSPVTIADYGSQAIICSALRRVNIHAQIIGEEDSAALKDDPPLLERVRAAVHRVAPHLSTAEEVCEAIDAGSAKGGDIAWALDPIDGTKGFLRGEQYAIALGKIEKGNLTVGVLGCPNLSPQALKASNFPSTALERAVGLLSENGGAVVAVGGQGCRAFSLEAEIDEEGEEISRGTPCRVSDTTDVQNAYFIESVESGHSALDVGAQLLGALGVKAEPLHMDSQCKYAAVAMGLADVYLRIPIPSKTPGGPTRAECIWDHAAGVLAVVEAGGRVSDLDGKDIDWTTGDRLSNNRGILATNGHLHEVVLAAIKSLKI